MKAAILRSALSWGLMAVTAGLFVAGPPAQAQSATSLLSFVGPANGLSPQAHLCQAKDGNLYGTTGGGGLYGDGTVFRITTGGAVTTLYSFSGGLSPSSGLIQGTDGDLYGTTFESGGENLGTVFRITTGGVLTTLHRFTAVEGCDSVGGLVQATDGNLYGTTSNPSTNGTVFKITTAGALTTLHVFTGSDGQDPFSGLIQATDGNLYGTTSIGGANNRGTVFRITTGGALTTLYSFSGTAEFPSSLIQATDGNLYGTTEEGGVNGGATVFKITPGGALTTLYSFAGTAEFAGRLIQATDGNIYGTTVGGGVNGDGMVFKITTDGAFTPLYSFAGIDGTDPSGLTQATDGSLYGTTLSGGANGLGTLFRITTGGVLTTLYSFTNLGANPNSGLEQDACLLQATDGNLYGTTYYGGSYSLGMVYKLVSVNRDDLLLSNHADLLFQRSDTGQLAYWLLDQTAQTSVGSFSPANPGSTDWKLAGTGDINGDSNFDIIWQSQSTGTLAYWLMNGPNKISGGLILPSSPGSADWQVASVVDLNGDFSPDLIFQNAKTGDIGFWLMNGTTKTTGALFSPSNPGSPAWKLVASYHNYTADTTTLYFQNSQTGTLAYWLMNAGQVMTSSGLLNPSNAGSLDWRFAALEDINGDGQPDIIWQNAKTGAVAYWLMNGQSKIGGGLFSPSNAGYPLWQVVGAH